MSQFSQSEVNSIREVAMCHLSTSKKFSSYANQCQDPQIKQMFQKAGTDAQTAAQNLIKML